MSVRDLIVSPETQEGFSSGYHRGTVIRRLISRETVSARHLEINVGVIEPGGAAEPHLHVASEQAVYILEGRAAVEVGGETAEIGPGEIVFFPIGVRHKVTAIGQIPLKVLGIYGPPLGDPATATKSR